MAPLPVLSLLLATVTTLLPLTSSHPYHPDFVDYNININPDPNAGVLDFDASWPEKQSGGYTPSPENWRSLPTYTVLLDKCVVRARGGGEGGG